MSELTVMRGILGRLRNMGAYPSVYSKMLEWLRGDAD